MADTPDEKRQELEEQIDRSIRAISITYDDRINDLRQRIHYTAEDAHNMFVSQEGQLVDLYDISDKLQGDIQDLEKSIDLLSDQIDVLDGDIGDMGAGLMHHYNEIDHKLSRFADQRREDMLVGAVVGAGIAAVVTTVVYRALKWAEDRKYRRMREGKAK